MKLITIIAASLLAVGCANTQPTTNSATLAELCAVGKPSLLIPSPNVTENHQEENARGLESAGAAVVVVEHGWDLDANVARVSELLADADGLAKMAAAAKGLAKLDAASHAADLVEGVGTLSAHDLTSDPAESRDVFGDLPASGPASRLLLQRLGQAHVERDLLDEVDSGAPIRLEDTEGLAEELAALGYAGGESRGVPQGTPLDYWPEQEDG